MIKKLLSLLLVLTISFSINFKTTNAIEGIEQPFNTYSLGSTGHVIYSTVFFEIPANPTYFEIYIPATNFDEFSSSDGTESKLILYSETKASSTYVTFEDLDGWREDYGSYILDEATLQLFNIDDYYFFQIELVHTHSSIASLDFLEWFSERFDYSFNTEIETAGANTVQYYIGTELYYTARYSDIPDQPIDPPYDNLYLVGWRDNTNALYNFDETLTPEPNGYAVLTAHLGIIWDDELPTTVDGTPSLIVDVLTSAGLYNVVGKIIIYFVLMLVATFVMIYFKLNTFIVMILNLLIFGVFIFFGWLPVYIIIPLGLMFLVGLFATIKGGI